MNDQNKINSSAVEMSVVNLKYDVGSVCGTSTQEFCLPWSFFHLH
jgi:hypothetical protein